MTKFGWCQCTSVCFKYSFLLMVVFFLGLMMSSIFQISGSSWIRQSFLPLPTLLERPTSDKSVRLTSLSSPKKRPRLFTSPAVPTTKRPTVKPSQNKSIIACPFPETDPYDPKIIQFIKKHPTLKCPSSQFKPSIVSVEGDKLTVDTAKLKSKLNLSNIDECKYRTITMHEGDDYRVVYGPWSKGFKTFIRLGDKDDNLQVDCNHHGKLVSRSYLALVRKKNETEKKRREGYQKHLKENAPKETLSVLMVGVDGTARQNFIRAMPKTREFLLKQLNAVEFEKYNKVGLNTFPNVVPLLTGKSEEELNYNRKEPFDSLDNHFIWNRFQKAGYRTAILMDMTRVTAFHYLKKGWAHPPFDFYPRPITIASETDRSVYRKGNDNCMGDTPEVTLLHDYWVQLATAYNNSPSTPYFGYSFMARLTHDDLNKASAGDELYLGFFQELKNKNVLNNTLLIFFSDHGERYGTIRNTYVGIIEAKTPLLYFVFPPWFEKKYPELMKKFRFNAKNRLKSHYDVHATLEDILHFTGKARESSPLDRSISLFSTIPSNRTCQSSGIPVKFCACTSLNPDKSTPEDVKKALANKLLAHVVSLTNKHRGKCEVLKLEEIKSVYSMTPEVALGDKKMFLYHVTIQTTPGHAVYEATLSYKTDNKAVSITGEVSRLNMYRGQAECVDDAKLRSFCYCKK